MLHGRYPASPLLWHLLTAPPLSRNSSPQVRCRIYPLVPPGSTVRVSDDFFLGFAVASQLAARARPHCRFVFLRSRVCYALLSASPYGYALRFATVVVIYSVELLSSRKILPMLGTLAQALLPAGPALLPGPSERAHPDPTAHGFL